MTTANRPELQTEHFLDAIALVRATLHADDTGLLAIVASAEVGMMMQALVQLHLSSLFAMADGDPEAVDCFLADSLVFVGKVGGLQ